MRILLYEFVRADGWRRVGWDPSPESLRREGAAMLAAVTADFAAIDNVEVVVAGARAQGAADGLLGSIEPADTIDWALVIAPETGGVLYDLCREVECRGARLLGPSSEFVRLTSNKHDTAQRLAAAGIPSPLGVMLAAGDVLPDDFCYPAVLKPVDGAGSQDTWFVAGPAAECGDVRLAHNRLPRRLERYCPGTSASVAVLCGPAAMSPLIPCRQRLSADGRFRYLGGELPLNERLSARARQLALRALGALPAARGYVGVDLVLGDDPAGCGDTVIEVNPRLTTSYVGLRPICRQNLAQSMLDAVGGKSLHFTWREGTLQFDAAGNVRRGTGDPPTPREVGTVE